MVARDARAPAAPGGGGGGGGGGADVGADEAALAAPGDEAARAAGQQYEEQVSEAELEVRRREQKQLETQRFAEVQDRYYAQSDAIDEMRARIQERTAELGIAADPMGKEITKEYLEKVAQKKEEMDREKALNVDIFGGKKLFDNYYGNFTSLPEALFYETTTLDLPTPLDLGRDTFVVFIIALLATIWVLFIDYVGEKALDPIFHFDISRQTGLGTLSDIVKGSDDASFIDAAPSAPAHPNEPPRSRPRGAARARHIFSLPERRAIPLLIFSRVTSRKGPTS